MGDSSSPDQSEMMAPDQSEMMAPDQSEMMASQMDSGSAEESSRPTGGRDFPSGPFCDRTAQVRDAIVDLIPGVATCGRVTDAHLAAVTGSLNLMNAGISSLRPDDFAGLANLQGLILSGNRLTMLPAGIFFGLTNLETLQLDNNQLQSLSEDLFAGLTNLQSLVLSRNRLTTLPANIFSGLTNLETLQVTRNQLQSLSEDLFAGLANLRTLLLSGNQLTTVPADIFSGLTNLETLRLVNNQLLSLPEDLFEGLAKLRILDLEFNQLVTLPTNLFAELNPWFLGLEGNQIQTLQAGLFDSLSGNQVLDLSHNAVTTLGDGVFANLGNVTFLDLANNQLQTLPSGVFEGLTSMQELYLENNPGSNFTFTMTVERVPGTNNVVVVVPEGAPFDMTTTVSATGGTLPVGVSTVTVPTGRTKSDEITVTPLVGATVSLGAAPRVPSTGDHQGFRTAVSNPLVVTSALRAAYVNTPPSLSVEDAEVDEGSGAPLAFTVTLSRPVSSTVTVQYETSDNTATEGLDYSSARGTLTVAAGDTRKTVSVAIMGDGDNEGTETLTLTLSNPSGSNAHLADAEATGTIRDSDAMPQAWLARFARTVAGQVVEAVEGRLRAASQPYVEVMLNGQKIGTAAQIPEEETQSPEGGHPLNQRDLLAGSSFSLAARADGGIAALWGRGVVSRFDGREGGLSMSGEVKGATLGVDWTRDIDSGSGAGPWTAGLLVSHARGKGSYRDDASGSGSGMVTRGEVSSTVTGLYPYGRYALNKRVTVWGTAGYGAGRLTLKPDGGTRIKTDIDLLMAAAGLRGTVVAAPAGGGPELAVKTDVMAVRASSEAVSGDVSGNLAAETAEAVRFRLGLEGNWRGLGIGAGTLEPHLMIGVRHDGGDAETGFGLEFGGGFAWSDVESGIRADVSGRSLLIHAEDGFHERGFAGSLTWDPGPGSDRGPRFMLSQTLGLPTSSGVDALLNRTTMFESLTATNDADKSRRWRLGLELGYGFPAFSGRFISMPEFGIEMPNGHRDYSLSWRLKRDSLGEIGSLELLFEGWRRESASGNAGSENGVGFRLDAGF